MRNTPTTSEDVRLLVEANIDAMPVALATHVRSTLRPAVRQTLHWEYGDREPYDAWRFADLGERDVWAAYCTGGHGALGCPWGLIFTHSDQFGMDSSWYSELSALFAEWFAS